MSRFSTVPVTNNSKISNLDMKLCESYIFLLYKKLFPNKPVVMYLLMFPPLVAIFSYKLKENGEF